MQHNNLRLKYGNQPIKLALKPFASGGEGLLFKIVSPAKLKGLVAKVYHPNKRTSNREKKINYLYKNKPLEYTKGKHTDVVWVLDLLYGDNDFLGFLMPFVQGDKLALLTLGKLPKKASSKWKRFSFGTSKAFDLRLKLCFNIAAAIYHTHNTNQYILIDLKPDNIVTQPNGLVSLVDMDSVEVVQNGQTLFDAPVATPEYTPPEHYKKDYPIDPTTSTSWDDFSMAVIFYQLLFGIHPFAASSLPPYDNLTGLHQKIEQGLFVYNPDYQDNFKVIPPPHHRFKEANNLLQQLFLRCFVKGHKAPEARPSAEEWCSVLADILNLSVDHILNKRLPSSLINWEEFEQQTDLPSNLEEKVLALVTIPKTPVLAIPKQDHSRQDIVLKETKDAYQLSILGGRILMAMLGFVLVVIGVASPVIVPIVAGIFAGISILTYRQFLNEALKTADLPIKFYPIASLPQQEELFLAKTNKLKAAQQELDALEAKASDKKTLAPQLKKLKPLQQKLQSNSAKLRHYLSKQDRLVLQKQKSLSSFNPKKIVDSALNFYPILKEFKTISYLGLMNQLNHKMTNHDGLYHSQYRAQKMNLELKWKEKEKLLEQEYDVSTLQNYIQTVDNLQTTLLSRNQTLGQQLKQNFKQFEQFPIFKLTKPNLNCLHTIYYGWEIVRGKIKYFDLRNIDRTEAKEVLKKTYNPIFETLNDELKFSNFLGILQHKIRMYNQQDINPNLGASLLQMEAEEAAKLALGLPNYIQKQFKNIQVSLKQLESNFKKLEVAYGSFYAEMEDLEISISKLGSTNNLAAFAKQKSSGDALLDKLMQAQSTRLEEFKQKYITTAKDNTDTVLQSYTQLLAFMDMLNSLHDRLNNKFLKFTALQVQKQKPISEQYQLKLKQLYKTFDPLLQKELADYYIAKDFLDEQYKEYLAHKSVYHKEHLQILEKSKQEINGLKQEAQQLQKQKAAIQQTILEKDQLGEKQKQYLKELNDLKEEAKNLSKLTILNNWAKDRTYWDYLKRLLFIGNS